MKKTEKKGIAQAIKKNPGKAVAIGAGAVALGAAAYYFLGPKSKEHQDSAKKWMNDAKKKVVKKMEESKEMTESAYKNLVNEVINPYMEKGAAGVEEAKAFAQAMKKDWKHFVNSSKKTVKAAPVKAKKAVTAAKKEIKNEVKKVKATIQKKTAKPSTKKKK